MTFSIVARSADGQSWGVAVASRFVAVGAVAPAAVAGLGALSTQAMPNVAFKPWVLALLDEGATAPVAVQRVVEDDDAPQHRQLGLVDAEGTVAAHTGDACLPWAGHLLGDQIACQGNMLTGPEVLTAMREAYDASPADLPLARRLLAALAAGDAAGGDHRGRQSAALLVVQEGVGYGGLDDVAVDLRVDDHTTPIPELERLLGLLDEQRSVEEHYVAHLRGNGA